MTLKTVVRILLPPLASTPPSAAAAAHLASTAARAERDLVAAAAAGCPGCPVADFARRPLGDGIAEYSFTLRVGSGGHDRIGLHRVVAEIAPFQPAPAARGVFMVHGDLWGFDGAFLASADSAAVDDGQALSVFLARHGVDVWGIDFRWVLVPDGTIDFAFMSTWGLATHADDLGTGLAVARAARAATGSGAGKLALLGWSRGGLVSYVYLGGESQRPPPQRHVSAFIPVDIYVKTDDPTLRANACNRLQVARDQLDAGQFADPTGGLIQLIGLLAAGAPGDPSPVVPGLTNRQTALLVGAATFALFEPDQVFAPFYHFTGGTFDEFGVPDGLLYTDEDYLFDFLPGAATFEAVRLGADSDAMICDQDDVTFDDHFGDVSVPVLYVGAGGGFGDLGVYSTTLLGSSDVTVHVAQLLPPEGRLFDYGHADLFLAGDAESRVWQPILDWLTGH